LKEYLKIFERKEIQNGESSSNLVAMKKLFLPKAEVGALPFMTRGQYYALKNAATF
jgi:hypothetical protein